RVLLHSLTAYLLECDHGRCRCYEKSTSSQVLTHTQCTKVIADASRHGTFLFILHAIPCHPIPCSGPWIPAQPPVGCKWAEWPHPTTVPSPSSSSASRFSSLLSLQCCTSYPWPAGFYSVCPSKSPGWTRLQQVWQLAFSLLLSLCILFHQEAQSRSQRPEAAAAAKHPIFQSLTLSSSLPVRYPT
ncbi:uncharacterized protein CCOS01_15959, partial [Colletotrichum costaricense]